MANGFDPKRGSPCGRDRERDRDRDAARLGSRRIFAPQFKLQVLDSYRNDSDCRGNQRATARKYGIHRRQIQKWLQAEGALRGAVEGDSAPSKTGPGPVDLSVRRAPSPDSRELLCPSSRSPSLSSSTSPSSSPPASPLAWDLSIQHRRKVGYEVEAPPPPPAPAPPQFRYKLFRPFLPEDNFEEVEMPSPPAAEPPADDRLGPEFAYRQRRALRWIERGARPFVS